MPAASQAFDSGWIDQRLHWPGVWLERGRVAADDTRLLDSAHGLAGQRALGTVWFASQRPWIAAQSDGLLDAARELASRPGLAALSGATAVDARLVLLRALAPNVEPLFELLREVRAAWRRQVWHLDAAPPRVWRT